jgi:hypothetical protein
VWHPVRPTPPSTALENRIMSTSKGLRTLGIVAIVFGVMTLISGGQALFLGLDQGVDMGQVVPAVLWFNFIAGFAYLVAGIGLLRGLRWSARLAAALAAATLLMFAYLGVHIAMGGPYEMRTVMAMTLRAAFWIMVAWVALRAMRQR